MKRLPLLLFLVSAASPAGAQQKIPVRVAHKGDDAVGAALTDALKNRLSKSAAYELASTPDPPRQGAKFYVHLATIDASAGDAERGSTSAVSVLIEQRVPGDWPVPHKWYHKIVIVDRASVDEIARRLVEDMYASYCEVSKSSLGGCPQPRLP